MMIVQVLTAAKKLYDQVDKARHNAAIAQCLVESINQLMKQVDAASPIASDKLDSTLNDALQWIEDASQLMKEFEEQGWDLKRIKRFVNASGYQRQLDDLFRRLGTLQNTFNAVCNLNIQLNQKRYEEALQAHNSAMITQLNEIEVALSQASADRQESFDDIKNLINELRLAIEHSTVRSSSQQKSMEVTVALRTAWADVENALALKVTGPDDYAPERVSEIAELSSRLQEQGVSRATVHQGGAVAKQPGSHAVVMPSTDVAPSAQKFAASLMGLFNNTRAETVAEAKNQLTNDNLDKDGKKNSSGW